MPPKKQSTTAEMDPPRQPRDNWAYLQGQRSFIAGRSWDACPYAWRDPKRMDWLDGFLDARTGDRLKHVFGKRGIKWP